MKTMKKGMGKPMKKAQNGTVAKKKPAKTYPIISESGDLADALNETMRMRKAGTVPKTGKDAGKFMDRLNKEGKLGPAKSKMKMGGAMKKAQNGKSFGMASVNAGYDNNSDATAADRIVLAKKNAGKAKNGAMMKMGGKMAKQAAIAIAMKKAGKAPKKKMQYGGEAASMKPKGMKKAMMGTAMTNAPMMKKGGSMKKCKYGCK
jgi:hypothetical protein